MLILKLNPSRCMAIFRFCLKTLGICAITVVLNSCSSTEVETSPPIEERAVVTSFQDFNPKTYIAYKSEAPITVDGKLNETDWKNAQPTDDFVDIEGDKKPNPYLQTYTKMLWDEEYFYFGAYLKEPHIWATLTERDAVMFHDNDFEIFIDPDGDTHQYYEFEMNAHNAIWDLLLMTPYRDVGGPKVLNHWDIRGIKTAVHIEGTLNQSDDEDDYWSVEVAIPWKVLNEMSPTKMPKDHQVWRVNFSRVQWHTDIIDGQYIKQTDEKGRKKAEENWVWSPQGAINMHMPEMWGFVKFSPQSPSDQSTFRIAEDEYVKFALRKMYYQQYQYFRKNKTYLQSMEEIEIPEVEIENYSFEPELFTYPNGYIITSKSVDGLKQFAIREDGKLMVKNL